MYTFKQSDESLIVFDPGSRNTLAVRGALASYKKRWQESLASTIAIASTLEEIPKGSNIIVPEFVMYQLNPLHYEKITTVPSIQQITHYDLRRSIVNPIVTQFNDVTEFISHIEDLNLTIAAFDFETAGKFSKVEVENFKNFLTDEDDDNQILLRQQIAANGLSHPSLVRITHLSVGISETESSVLTISKDAELAICEWLTTTGIAQVWHNASFDFKLLKHRVNAYPKSFEDTQLMWYTILNHADSFQARTGLKILASKIYGSWGSEIKDLFNIESMHDPRVSHYAGVDTIATMFLYNEAMVHPDFQGDWESCKLEDLLPESNPKDVASRKTRRYFYENVLKQLIEPTVDLMMQGITVDNSAINNLKSVIDNVLVDVDKRLASSEIVQEFRSHSYKSLRQKKVDELNSKKRSRQHYLKEYKDTDVVHRSYVVNEYLRTFEANNFTFDLSFWPADVLPDGSTKWTVNDVKKMRAVNALPLLDRIIDKSIALDDPLVQIAMYNLAEYKRDKYNDGYDLQIEDIDLSIVPQFKPGSSQQKAALFSFLEIPCEAQTKEGADSWSRDEITRVNKSTSDQAIKDLTQIFIDHSMSKIIRSNFLAAFDTFVVDGKLLGNYRIGGAKSMRYTSNSPNMLNMPSTGSIYATPLKKCFVAQPGFLIATADFAALQEVTIANITEDANKIKILGGGFDSHCFHASTYYPRIEQILGHNDGSLDWNKNFKKECNSNKELKSLRQDSKPISFKLAFGGFPDIDKGGNITQSIFDKYHNELYPGVTAYNNNVVMSQASKERQTYLGMGFHIRTDDPAKHNRTICNATAQFWDIISALTMAEMRQRIKLAGYERDILLTSTIYDSLYYECRKDATILQWLNNNLVEVMTKQMFTYQPVPNASALDIGPNWSELTELENNCSLEEVQRAIDKMETIDASYRELEFYTDIAKMSPTKDNIYKLKELADAIYNRRKVK